MLQVDQFEKAWLERCKIATRHVYYLQRVTLGFDSLQTICLSSDYYWIILVYMCYK